MKSLFMCSLLFFLLSCTADQPDCYITDVTEILDTTKINDITYSLVLKTSGFSDKVMFVELYRGVPEYDACGNSSLKPIYVEVVDKLDSNVVRVLNDKFNFVEANPELPITYKNIRFDQAHKH